MVGSSRHSWLRMGARAIIALGAAALITLSACDQRPAWEYRIEAPLDHHFTERMNHLGGEGWEIVSLRRVETDDRDLEEFKREWVPKAGKTPEEVEMWIREKLPKMKYEVVMKRHVGGAK